MAKIKTATASRGACRVALTSVPDDDVLEEVGVRHGERLGVVDQTDVESRDGEE